MQRKTIKETYGRKRYADIYERKICGAGDAGACGA